MNRVAAAAVLLSASMSSCLQAAHVCTVAPSGFYSPGSFGLVVVSCGFGCEPGPVSLPTAGSESVRCLFFFLSACHDKLHRYSRPQRTWRFPEPGSVVDGWWWEITALTFALVTVGYMLSR